MVSLADQLVQLPAGHWTGERAARDILIVAGKDEPWHLSIHSPPRQGGQQVHYGSALALALNAWARHAGTPVSDSELAIKARTVIRKPS